MSLHVNGVSKEFSVIKTDDSPKLPELPQTSPDLIDITNDIGLPNNVDIADKLASLSCDDVDLLDILNDESKFKGSSENDIEKESEIGMGVDMESFPDCLESGWIQSHPENVVDVLLTQFLIGDISDENRLLLSNLRHAKDVDESVSDLYIAIRDGDPNANEMFMEYLESDPHVSQNRKFAYYATLFDAGQLTQEQFDDWSVTPDNDNFNYLLRIIREHPDQAVLDESDEQELDIPQNNHGGPTAVYHE